MGYFHLLRNYTSSPKGKNIWPRERKHNFSVIGNAILIRNERISSCILFQNPLRTHWIWRSWKWKNPPGKNPHCIKKSMNLMENASVQHWFFWWWTISFLQTFKGNNDSLYLINKDENAHRYGSTDEERKKESEREIETEKKKWNKDKI